ncbi:putative indoleamine 2,3-dioxygenase family protein [Venustampulla echinocandica]|uniref:Indoleamine 2,3-dioxygenase n=1 Tax=Venustampulla echinocandica TaxID=2656787 RepID=A0A370TLH5_9HELO|nr:putative indoleamine 2,3-dioxygenase family protein [Venustampulla echinocandica]RDL36371.1 putative indoleamine 2,3-dioxygenase family protein [Venustampulla echinocandica]
MLPPSSTHLAEFEISSRNGFLPDQPPLQKLDDTYYASWEAIIGDLPGLLNSSSLRNEVDHLPILSTSRLRSEREWQRAYLILSFVTHAYIWEAPGPSERLPPSISVPFLKVSSHLQLPPTATYAALSLWNFKSSNTDCDLSRIEDLQVLHTFTGTQDEEWFYLISVAIEAQGAEAIPLMLNAIDAVESDNSPMVIAALKEFSYLIRKISLLLKRMHEKCSPEIFYNEIRPYFAGSKNMGLAGLPNGVFYDEGEGNGQWQQYSGGSNAQSSLIQFFDIVLGVEHFDVKGTKGSKHGFLRQMRSYMPGPHCSFLEHLESIANIRAYAEQTAVPEVTEAYNFAVKELESFRDIHIQIVARYIIMPSRQHVSTGHRGVNLAIASANPDVRKDLHGTGGTELMPFLRQSRDETRAAALS